MEHEREDDRNHQKIRGESSSTRWDPRPSRSAERQDVGGKHPKQEQRLSLWVQRFLLPEAEN